MDVFKADVSTGMWVPMTASLDGHAIFISKLFSKSVSACWETIKDDDIVFDDTGEVFNLRSQSIRASKAHVFDIYSLPMPWIFSPRVGSLTSCFLFVILF